MILNSVLNCGLFIIEIDERNKRKVPEKFIKKATEIQKLDNLYMGLVTKNFILS